MGKLKAFMEVPRLEAGYRPLHERIHDFGEVEQTLNSRDRMAQASRCMDCGVPFCHWACPLGNKDSEWNDALCKGDWELAYRLLNATNDFPEFTGRICPALCEKACVLNLTDHAPVTNRENEAAITETAWHEDYIKPMIFPRNGKSVAVIGAGAEEIIQYLIVIGSTDQLINGKPHILRIKCCQNVTEVTGGNYDIDLLTLCDLTVFT